MWKRRARRCLHRETGDAVFASPFFASPHPLCFSILQTDGSGDLLYGSPGLPPEMGTCQVLIRQSYWPLSSFVSTCVLRCHLLQKVSSPESCPRLWLKQDVRGTHETLCVVLLFYKDELSYSTCFALWFIPFLWKFFLPRDCIWMYLSHLLSLPPSLPLDAYAHKRCDAYYT